MPIPKILAFLTEFYCLYHCKTNTSHVNSIMQNKEKHLCTLLVQKICLFRCEIKLKFDNTCIYCRLSKDKELSNLHLEPTTSRIANVVSSLPYPKLHSASPLPPVNPPPLPPRNPAMASMQHSLPPLDGRSSQEIALQSIIDASVSVTLGRASQNKCLQSNYIKLKVALTIAVLAVVMVTVPVVYTSFINQKTEIPYIHTTEIPNINTSEIPNINTTEIPNSNTSALTQITDVPTVNNNLTSVGMYIIFIQ